VVFGLYDESGLEALRREYGDGRFVLGGCVDGDAEWCCKACGATFSGRKITDQGWTDKQRQIIDQLKAEGKMPTLEQVLEVMAEVQKEYRPKILAARAEHDQPAGSGTAATTPGATIEAS
jgi:hypothetical protein